MSRFLPLLATQTLRTTFEWGRIESNADWILPIAAFVGAVLFVRWMYRKDAVELGPVLSWTLTFLRVAVFVGLLIVYLEPRWRVEREIVKNSRVAVLADTSLSMGLVDAGASVVGEASSRSGQLADALSFDGFLPKLREVHDVGVFAFDSELRPLARVAKVAGADSRDLVENGETSVPSRTDSSSGRDWKKLTAPKGIETRLAPALAGILQDDPDAPLAAVILLTDGRQNAGTPPDAPIRLAQDREVPVFAIGIGSTDPPANLRVSDLAVPSRAYPGDPFDIIGYIQGSNVGARTVTVELLMRKTSPDAAAESGTLVEKKEISIPESGETVAVRFEVVPDELGWRTYCLRVQAPEEDRNPTDNAQEADVEIVDQKTKVLLFAGGPSREYRFLRTMLYRDKGVEVDVLLQSAPSGISQEADEILDNFPADRKSMFEYDCVVAFDPDWRVLTAAQMRLFEDFIGRQGGGAILIAGAVHAGDPVSGWTQDEATKPIRTLYPVEFERRFSTVDFSLEASEEPWPLEFTREGREAEFLWLADTMEESAAEWAEFPGVYGFFANQGVKPGATVYARFSDPRAAAGEEPPVYFAGQFFGSGRVFYMGSGEMWRLRQFDPTRFETFYTKLIRHVSQGRLLRGSPRGMLLTDKGRYFPGNVVEVRAQINDANLEPYQATEVPLRVVSPDRKSEELVLRPDPSQAGMYAARFSVFDEGTYQLRLPVPEGDGEELARRIQVQVPNLEQKDPRRDDAMLSRVAMATGGTYYVGMDEALGPASKKPLIEQIKDKTKTIVLTEIPNPDWERDWMRWMLLALCGLLCIEWLIRRLLKLA